MPEVQYNEIPEHHKFSKKYKTYLFIFLGALAAFGPLVTDMYLPALPQLSGFFKTTPSMVQLGLTASLVGLAIGQLIIGPLSDKYGRRYPLMISLWIFLAATIGCLFAPNIELFTLFRLIQGMAGSGGIVISRSVTTDIFSGHDLAKSFAIIAAVQGIAPTTSPVIGGAILRFSSWQGIFAILAGMGVVLIILAFLLKESLKPENRLRANFFATFKQFVPVLKNPEFRDIMLVQAVSFGILFGYISSSPFIFQQKYGLSPLAFSICFALNAVGLGLGNIVTAKFKDTWQGLKLGVMGCFILCIIHSTVLLTVNSVVLFGVTLWLMLVFLGIVLPTSMTLAMECEKQRAGTASSLLGAFGFMVGGIASPLVGLGNIMHSTAIIYLVSVIGMVLCFINARRK